MMLLEYFLEKIFGRYACHEAVFLTSSSPPAIRSAETGEFGPGMLQ